MDLQQLRGNNEGLTESDLEYLRDLVTSVPFCKMLAVELRRVDARDTLGGKVLTDSNGLSKIYGEIIGGRQMIERILAYGLKEEKEDVSA